MMELSPNRPGKRVTCQALYIIETGLKDKSQKCYVNLYQVGDYLRSTRLKVGQKDNFKGVI